MRKWLCVCVCASGSRATRPLSQHTGGRSILVRRAGGRSGAASGRRETERKSHNGTCAASAGQVSRRPKGATFRPARRLIFISAGATCCGSTFRRAAFSRLPARVARSINLERRPQVLLLPSSSQSAAFVVSASAVCLRCVALRCVARPPSRSYRRPSSRREGGKAAATWSNWLRARHTRRLYL